MKLLSENPFYTSLNTHEISDLTKRYGMKVWQSYLENKTSNFKVLYENGLSLKEKIETIANIYIYVHVLL